jgi:hypothetical protein
VQFINVQQSKTAAAANLLRKDPAGMVQLHDELTIRRVGTGEIDGSIRMPE